MRAGFRNANTFQSSAAGINGDRIQRCEQGFAQRRAKPSRSYLGTFQRWLAGASNWVLAAMSLATPITKSSSGSVPVLVKELDSPIRIGIASPVRTGAVSEAAPLTASVPLPAST